MTSEELLNCLVDRPCSACKYHKENGCSKWNCVFEEPIDEAEPCDDCISDREKGEWVRWYEDIQRGSHYTEHIPHCKCSQCDKEQDPYSSQFINFCPNCGADMRKGK